jgi:hypothetical protein
MNVVETETCNIKTVLCFYCHGKTQGCRKPNCKLEHEEVVGKASVHCQHDPQFLTDFRGVPFVPGATVVYPGRHSSSLWMTEAIIVGFKKYPPQYWQPSDSPGTCALVVKHNDKGSSTYMNRDGKEVILTRIDRVVVVASPE